MKNTLICFVVGTGAEAIRIAPVIRAVQRKHPMASLLVSSGQDFEQVRLALQNFGLTPDLELAHAGVGGSLMEFAAGMMPALDAVLTERRPAACVVLGDSITASSSALAAFWQHIPVVHLEAGLRSGELSTPSTEEGHRRIIDHLSALQLAPTPGAAMNLVREGRTSETIVVTGNPVVDAIQEMASRDIPYTDTQLTEVEDSCRRIVLLAMQRRDSWGQPLLNTIEAVRRIVATEPDVHVVMPVDRDSKARWIVQDGFAGIDRVMVCDPLTLGDQARLLANSSLVLTDSSELQEQAPAFDVPVLVLRDVPERPEAISAGVAKLIGVNPTTIVREALDVLAGSASWNTCGLVDSPFGDGQAARRAVEAIGWKLGCNERPDAFQPDQANAVLARPLLFRVA
ncbi:MAG: UDP-N-acetylglucosamine 2-epimerase (non-hydrolyzing) [Thermomicrobiales bacterium]